jgi:hypothetical protein
MYAPTRRTPISFHEVNVILGNMEWQIILGDFNQVIDKMIDVSTFTGNSTPKYRLAIHLLTEDMGLTEIRRLVHPNDREYLFSQCHKTHSRIDSLISNCMVNNVIDCKTGPIALTDHARLELHNDIVTNRLEAHNKKGRQRGDKE